MILRISLICLNFLFSQLLNRIPTNIVPIPIHKNGIIPEINFPTMISSVRMSRTPKSAEIFSIPTLVTPAGIAAVSTVYTSGNVEIANLLTNEVVVGQFVSGMIPFLWIGIGTVFVGILFSNWLNRKLRHISDLLRIIVLVALYPTVHQFTNILMHGESSFSLIVPLIAGFAVTAASATLLIRRYRKRGSKELEQ